MNMSGSAAHMHPSSVELAQFIERVAVCIVTQLHISLHDGRRPCIVVSSDVIPEACWFPSQPGTGCFLQAGPRACAAADTGPQHRSRSSAAWPTRRQVWCGLLLCADEGWGGLHCHSSGYDVHPQASSSVSGVAGTGGSLLECLAAMMMHSVTVHVRGLE